jgi:hypothetical protein
MYVKGKCKIVYRILEKADKLLNEWYKCESVLGRWVEHNTRQQKTARSYREDKVVSKYTTTSAKMFSL